MYVNLLDPFCATVVNTGMEDPDIKRQIDRERRLRYFQQQQEKESALSRRDLKMVEATHPLRREGQFQRVHRSNSEVGMSYEVRIVI